MSKHRDLVEIIRWAKVELRLKDGRAQFRAAGLSPMQVTWLDAHRVDLTQGLTEELVSEVFGEVTVAGLLEGDEAVEYWSTQSTPAVIPDPAVAHWIAIASRVIAGDFDTLHEAARGRKNPAGPPVGSLAKSLLIGLHAVSEHAVAKQAIDYLNGKDPAPRAD